MGGWPLSKKNTRVRALHLKPEVRHYRSECCRIYCCLAMTLTYLASVYVVELTADVAFLYDTVSRKKENQVDLGADVT